MDEVAMTAALEKARQERLEKFLAEYRELAARHGCDFVAQPVIAEDGTIRCTITAVPVR